MEELSINTPALLFPAITLLMLAYTNRFLAIASRIRHLHEGYSASESKPVMIRQIKSLRKRINLIRYMQAMGAGSFLCCVLCMYCIFRNWMQPAHYIFAFSLITLLISIILSILEILQSTKALEYELSDIEGLQGGNIFTDLFHYRDDEESKKKDEG
jgi:hypothetical protein